jgi:transketolase
MKITNKDIFEICEIASKSKEGHIGSSLSILNILNSVYENIDVNLNPFILSKGHASLGLYLILKKYQFITQNDFESFCEYNSILGGHPHFRKIPGIFGSTGSLGHGLPIAVGKALGFKALNSNSFVTVLIGDGELNEGSNWEAFMLASHHNLDNINCIVDFNKSSERALSVINVPKAISELGWNVIEVDGHDEVSILKALNSKVKNKPNLIWANTIKGKGISFMEGNPEWHHKSPTYLELDLIKKELNYA